MTRGERNNNPGNIERNATVWKGMAPDQSTDSRFCVFMKPEYGIRALACILRNYRTRHDANTIREIINRWAPPGENETGAYVAAVAHDAGITPDADADVTNPEIMAAIVRAIVRHENGGVHYDDATIEAGVQGAFA